MSKGQGMLKQSSYQQPRLSQLALAILLSGSCVTGYTLEPMQDDELSDVSGKELINFTSIMPNELGNPNDGVGFYRIGLDAQLDINANIKALRLGCDSPNPTSSTPCDINIDQLSLTGLAPKLRTGYEFNGNNDIYNPNDDEVNGNTADGLNVKDQLIDYPIFGTLEDKVEYTRLVESQYFNPTDIGPITDFVMDKPFIELAIKNPESNNLANRELVGFRLGAEEVWGTINTGEGPTIGDSNIPAPPEIIGPGRNGANTYHGSGEAGIESMWRYMQTRSAYGSGLEERFETLQYYINESIENGHTGVNSISGRLPVRLDNMNVHAKVYNPLGLNLIPGAPIATANAQAAIVAGNLNRASQEDFGQSKQDYPAEGITKFRGYLRNTYLGDRDTVYDASLYGNYAANIDLQGRAIEFKRSQRAYLDNMIINIDVTNLNLIGIPAGNILGLLTALLGNDGFNNQDISARTFHQLEYGTDINNNLRYDKGEGAKHLAFQYQTLDGLQWITTDKRFANSYDLLGNPAQGATILGPSDQEGYDWLSTRAGWWLESPIANVRNAYVPPGQAALFREPSGASPLDLKSLDLGARPIDNCYGSLTFC